MKIDLFNSDDFLNAVNEINAGKALGKNGFPVERLKKGGVTVFEWSMRPLNKCFDLVWE